MGDEKNGGNSLGDKYSTSLLAWVGLAALMVTMCRCIAKRWCSRPQPGPSTPPTRSFPPQIVEMPSSIKNSMAELIPAHKYQKGMKMEGDDGTCSVCLCDFEEGDEIRTLPVCLHPYHAPCIDMWLYSHSNCPICRAVAVPPPQIL